MDALIDTTGWLGAIALLSAYRLVSAGRLDGDGAAFQLLNLAGATALLANSSYHRAWPSAGLNAVWLVIGLIALARAKRSAARSSEQDRVLRER
jgi:hypothetical protein